MYNPSSLRAEEFICHEEILATLQFAEMYKKDKSYLHGILQKAKSENGLTHREAAVLLMCDMPEIRQEVFALAAKIKQDFYGNRIVLFAPLYLSNYCVNGCVYCPYHVRNKNIVRRKMSQEEIADEVRALQDMGHKRLALELGEDPVHNPLEYVLESMQTIYGVKHKNGDIRRVNVNIAATTAENYRRLRDAGIGTYILFQETYNREAYEKLHPYGPKHDYDWHTEAMDRAMNGGIDDVGLGVLFGLANYAYEFVGLLMHAEHLEACYGVGPHTISVPRLRPADDVRLGDFNDCIDDEIFAQIVACLRVAVPYTGMIISTRESSATRERMLNLGISQISGGSRTSVGGYAKAESAKNSAQFEVNDERSLDEIVQWLMQLKHVPSFCTACYRMGRTGDRFMELCKSRQIHRCCHPNALFTLQEYLCDYASKQTRRIGEEFIAEELSLLPSELRTLVASNLMKISSGQKRDIKF